MTILDSNYLLKQIVSKLESYANSNYIETFVLVNYNTPGFALSRYICKQIPSKKTIIFDKISDWFQNERERSLIIGTINRNEAEHIRSYRKYDDGLADIFPIASLYYSEILELLKDMTWESNPKIDQVLTYSDVEWADRENERTKIIVNSDPPNKSRFWFRYTLKQQEILSRLHQREKVTRHKQIHAPIWQFRHEGLVR